MTKFCSYFVEHRETSELGSGIIPARPSCPIHLLVVSENPKNSPLGPLDSNGIEGAMGAILIIVNTEVVRNDLRADGNCIQGGGRNGDTPGPPPRKTAVPLGG